MGVESAEAMEWREKAANMRDQTSKKIRIAVIGCGDIAVRKHIPTIVNEHHAQLVALCDLDETRIARLAAQFHIPHTTSDYTTLLASPELDAVIIATPPWITPHIAIEFLHAGKHVLCEKPMAVNVEVAERVAQAEKQSGRKIQIGFTYRHGLLMNTLKSWIEQGLLGSPLVYRISVFDETWNPQGDPEHYDRIMKTMETGSPSLHDGAHIADFLNFLTGSTFTTISSFGAKSREEFPATNYDVSVIRFANGDMAKVEIGWFYPTFPGGEFEVVGPCGIAIYDRAGQFVELRAGDQVNRVILTEDWADSCFREQLNRFIHSIVHDEPCVPGAAEGLASLRLTAEIQNRLRTRDA